MVPELIMISGLLKKVIKNALYYSGASNIPNYMESKQNKILLILMYHNLIFDEDANKKRWLLRKSVTRSQFASHLDFIGKYFRVISTEKAVEEIKNEGNLREHSMAVTFDDGYASVYDIAFPLLRRYNFPATIFLTTDFINRKMKFWWEELTDMVLDCEIKNIDIDSLSTILHEEDTGRIRNLGNDIRSKRIFLRIVEPALRDMDDDSRLETMRKILKGSTGKNGQAYNKIEALKWVEINEMAGAGITFGAHTCSHPSLSRLNTKAAEAEIALSKSEIEGRTNKEIKGFVYPYGDDSSTYSSLIPILKSLNFSYACTAISGVNDKDTNPYLLFRLALPAARSRGILNYELCSTIKSG